MNARLFDFLNNIPEVQDALAAKDANGLLKLASKYRVSSDFCLWIVESSLAESFISELNFIPAYFFVDSNVKSVNIPEGISRVSAYAFSRCIELEEVTLPNSITEIDEGAFLGCKKLSKVNIPASVEKIDNSAFAGCNSLPEILNLPEGLKSIGLDAYKQCTSLKKVTIPKSVDEIHINAFELCDNLEEVTILNPNIYIQRNAFKSDFNLKVLNLPKKFFNLSGLTLEEVFKLVDLDKVQINYI